VTERVWNNRRILPVAAALAFALVMGALVVFSGVPQPQIGETAHLFTLDAPEARSVAVVGDFNGWDPAANPLSRADGIWQTVVSLRRGNTYFYNFLIDGEKWITDPAQLQVSEDGFGKKSVLELDASREAKP
jgi:1,4-alpha-glucan branching enzyme